MISLHLVTRTNASTTTVLPHTPHHTNQNNGIIGRRIISREKTRNVKDSKKKSISLHEEQKSNIPESKVSHLKTIHQLLTLSHWKAAKPKNPTTEGVGAKAATRLRD